MNGKRNSTCRPASRRDCGITSPNNALSLLRAMLIAIFSISGFGAAFAADTDRCAFALVMSTYNSNFQYSQDARLSVLVDSNTWDKLSHNFGAQAIIYGVPMGVNYSDYHDRAEHLLSQQQSSLSISQAQNISWTGLDPQSSSIYADCVKSVSSEFGLHLFPVVATSNQILLNVKWTPQGVGAPPQIHVTWTGAGVSLKDLPEIVTQGGTLVAVARPSTEQVLIVHYPGNDDAVTVTPLPPPLPLASQIATLSLGSCTGLGGVDGVRLWGPTDELCGGMSDPRWGRYDAQVHSVSAIGWCVGRGGVDGVRLYGPVGEACGGITTWGVYGGPIDISHIGLSSCTGLGGVNGVRMWGPTGEYCGGINATGWGRYDQGTRKPQ